MKLKGVNIFLTNKYCLLKILHYIRNKEGNKSLNAIKNKYFNHTNFPNFRAFNC